MRIDGSTVALQSNRAAVSWTRERTEVEVRRAPPPPPEDPAAVEEDRCLDGQPDLRSWLAKLLLEAFTGRRLAEGPEREARPGRRRGQERGEVQVELRHERLHVEAEAVQVRAEGRVTTGDGRTIDFGLQLDMRREHVQRETLHVSTGVKKDPLVLHLSGAPTRLEGPRTAFDLDGDGRAEHMATPSAGSAFLALDRDGNGTIDSGRELFGPQSGDGFAELALLDEDADGWIDEDDGAWGRLRLWDTTSGALQSLAQAGVGAIHTGSVRSAFALGDTAATAPGFVAATGVFLHEDGRAGAVQHIDLVV